MNYPLDSLVWIAPTIFILLIIAAPIIGVFAGWKRAAYWGGGSFFFFLLGVIFWKTLGGQIVASFSPALTKLITSISSSITITTRLLVSVCAPVFFIAVMIIAEIILVINYYAWFKKVSGIKKDIKIKKDYKKDKNSSKDLKGWKAMQLTTKGKVINMACGGVGLGLLLAPSTITFTQALLYTTTSVETRANNKFASNFYNAMQNPIKPFSWMSYYGDGDTAKDYNSLFSLLALSTNETEYTYFDSNGNEVTAKGNVTEAITNVVTGGIQTIIKTTTEGGTTVEEKVDSTNESITSLAKQWNTLVDANSTSVNSVFSSESVSEILKNVIGDTATTKQEVTQEQIEENYLAKDSVFSQVYDYYVNERSESEKLVQIPVSEETFNNIVDSINAVVIVADGTDATVKQQFQDKLADCAALMFKIV